jgi:FKBP-type peptidyl-prolyl cis-trans isomerase (trigger factor)
MIKKLYDYREVTVPAALLQAEVTREEMDAELALAAARFTVIVSVDGPVATGDVVALEYTDDKGLHRIYANVGKGFDDLEDRLPGLSQGEKVALRNVEATIVSVKRPTVPALTDEHVQQLSIEGVATTAQLEDHLFLKLAELQRKRKFRGIMGIVSKAIMEKTEFEDLLQHPWYLALHDVMMGRIAGFAAQNGQTVEEAMPAALRMEGKSLEECRLALQDMCLERAKQAALGQAIAEQNGAQISREGAEADMVAAYVDYLNEAVYSYFAPQIAVERL